MAFPGRVVKTYGRLQKKTVKQDNWISPFAAGTKVSSVFSSPEFESSDCNDRSNVRISENGSEFLVDAGKQNGRTMRKAARKANAVLQELNLNDVDPVKYKTRGQTSRSNETGKTRRFTKLSRKYNKLQEEGEKDSKTTMELRRRGNVKTKSSSSDSSFDFIYNLTKSKKVSDNDVLLSDNDCNISPIMNKGDSHKRLDSRLVCETSTPCDEQESECETKMSSNKLSRVTRRRARKEYDSPGLHAGGRLRAKRRRVVHVVSQILDFSDEGLLLPLSNNPQRQLRAKKQDVSDIASHLSTINLEDSLDDNHGRNKTQSSADQHGECHSLNGSNLSSCSVKLTRLQHISDQEISEALSYNEQTAEPKSDHKPLLRQPNADNDIIGSVCTPLTNRHLSHVAMDSFKVALTPTRSKTTGKMLSPRQKLLAQCDQDDFVDFTTPIPPSMMKKCVKIGEGVYGEVFRSTNTSRQSVALKIIPIEGDFEVNEENQKTFEEILPEIVISKELSQLEESSENCCSSYIHVNHVSCVRGNYPKKLLDQWDRFDKKKGSENDRPDIFPTDQLFIIFEFADGGRDLENFEFEDVHQAVSVLQQVTGALAIAERELDFEHRDLHWGNVLVRTTREDQIGFVIDGEEIWVQSQGLHISIIDFTLSRLQKDDCTVFCDLAEDQTLFTGEGDKQFDVYRSMQNYNNNEWESFNPKTNVFWLEYLTDKVVWEKKYPSDRSQRTVLNQLKTFLREVGQYCSAEDVLRNSELLSI